MCENATTYVMPIAVVRLELLIQQSEVPLQQPHCLESHPLVLLCKLSQYSCLWLIELTASCGFSPGCFWGAWILLYLHQGSNNNRLLMWLCMLLCQLLNKKKSATWLLLYIQDQLLENFHHCSLERAAPSTGKASIAQLARVSEWVSEWVSE